MTKKPLFFIIAQNVNTVTDFQFSCEGNMGINNLTEQDLANVKGV